MTSWTCWKLRPGDTDKTRAATPAVIAADRCVPLKNMYASSLSTCAARTLSPGATQLGFSSGNCDSDSRPHAPWPGPRPENVASSRLRFTAPTPSVAV